MSSIFVVLTLLSTCLSSPLSLVSPHRQFNSTNTTPFVLRASQPDSPLHLSGFNANDGHFWLGKPISSSCPAELAPSCRITGADETALMVSGDGYACLARLLLSSPSSLSTISTPPSTLHIPLTYHVITYPTLHHHPNKTKQSNPTQPNLIKYPQKFATSPAALTVYVAKDGALSFTAALEGDVASVAYPDGYSISDDNGRSADGPFTFGGTKSTGWLACLGVVGKDDWDGEWKRDGNEDKTGNGKGGPWMVYAGYWDGVSGLRGTRG